MRRPERFADYDPAALEVLTVAARWAEASGSRAVDSVALASAILEADWDGATLLAAHGVSLLTLEGVAIEPHEHDAVGLSPVVREALDGAEFEAGARGDSQVRIVDLLVGLAMTMSPVAGVFTQQGLRAHVLRRLAPPDD